MRLYEISICRNFASDFLYQEATSSMEAVFKKLNVKAKRAWRNDIDFIVTPVEKAPCGGYYKRGNRISLSIMRN